MHNNIAYQTDEIARYFSHNRISWPQFYESERVIISALNPKAGETVLDIGCGCGGLGLALRDQFGLDDYTGVEINASAATLARQMNPRARIFEGDILAAGALNFPGQQFDIVFSLSCVDWNVEFADMLATAWALVAPGGHLVATFRLTDGIGCRDMKRSYQYINYDGVREGECAPYVVLNVGELVGELRAFNPSVIHAFGYWGAPSATAITPYERLCFAAFSIQKRDSNTNDATQLHFNFPPEIQNAITQVV